MSTIGKSNANRVLVCIKGSVSDFSLLSIPPRIKKYLIALRSQKFFIGPENGVFQQNSPNEAGQEVEWVHTIIREIHPTAAIRHSAPFLWAQMTVSIKDKLGKFYDNKWKVALFYMSHVLPETIGCTDHSGMVSCPRQAGIGLICLSFKDEFSRGRLILMRFRINWLRRPKTG